MRPIKITPEVRAQLMNEMTQKIHALTTLGDTLSFSKKLKETKKEKVTIAFTAEAHLKMVQLVSTNKAEVGWHGIVDRISKNFFIISDILVYPQEVTGVITLADELGYSKFLMDLNDEDFQRLRFHGHSHVKMAVNPSSTDDNYRADLITNIRDDDYYIFLIINQYGDYNFDIYDFANNELLCKDDIYHTVLLENDFTITQWLKDQEAIVIPRVCTPLAPTTKNKKDHVTIYYDTKLKMYVTVTESGTKIMTMRDPRLKEEKSGSK